jgi:hypothetical protein
MTMLHVKRHVVQLLRHFSSDEQAQLLHLMSKLVDSLQAERQEQTR